jgi:HlyD family secretion protein
VSLASRAKQQLAVYRERIGLPAAPRAVLREALPFQNDIESIIDEPPPRWMRTVTLLVASLLVILIVMASVMKVESVVRASGHLAADKPTIVLQPMERSIIRELKVKAGDVVTKGQVLATLDATFSQADLDSLSSQQASLAARIRRAEAELNDTPYHVANAADSDNAVQAPLFRERKAQYASRLRAYDEAMRQLEANIRTMQDERTALNRQIAVAKNVEKIRATLLEAGLGSNTQYLDAQNIVIRTEREYQATSNRLVELRHEVETRRAERESFMNQWRGELLEGLGRDRNELSKIKDAISKATRMRDLVAVTAPDDGVVLDVAMRSVGSVLREAEPLVSLLPANAGMIADVMVASDDIGFIRPGDTVIVKVDAFPYQRHGMLRGRIRSIGEQSIPAGGRGGQVDPPAAGGGGGAAFHRVQVELTSTALDRMPEGVRLIPGMTVTGEVAVGERTIMSYLLDPVTRGFDESIREP